ncbi:GspH/FimT family pseudopilin [Ramlibacter montanisoli]|uniref:Type II secretion system protein H n=1 Tax=Ramlibacter montanisoli TaxID=2732512 RepID=A0A849K4I6_9BURK|nr:GspH/FimT family pseudopilin [Ramlibacter montanisoli]NNU43338.1 prepilin-type N-terminal cleavage/methylation domain-containing protein [Ramlibacter montanisoli]
MLRQRGFTLVELMIALTVFAVMATLVAPGAAEMIARRKVQEAAQSIMDGLAQARTEALRRNASVRFSLRADGIGWNVTQVGSGDTLRAYSNADWGSLQLASAGSAVSATFLPTGVLATGTQLSQLTVSSHAAQSASRRVNVYGGGMMRMCDPAIAVADDPRRC